MAVVVDFCTGKSIGEFQLQKTAETEYVFQMSEIEFCGWGVEAAEYINQGNFVIEYTGGRAYVKGKRVLEINLGHPIIKELRERVEKDAEDVSVRQIAELIYQTALMESGFVLNDPKDFASCMYELVKSNLDITPDAAVEEEDYLEEVVEVESEKKEATSSSKAEADEDIEEP